ncbi:IS1634 family transposase [Aromatoleum bremense]|uniref:IS1634 family transposase n=1 Tax=Aromatoleum bremense TaxID=76115 RepID=A0ABX1NRD7_9RHOO|nr:IS1634 family transposase [Aromatoleum bremense]NMG14251.1 IS1634 family transposase [Aromatoleum bremense]QTQ32926.1 Transposase, IS4-like [Aromatoleum bremense]QTQ34036.1 Transposase, IS4-like [Aromatoleum bremense]
MFVKITTSGGRRYVQLVESYRDDAGRVKKRTVATLGRLDQVGGELDSVINGLLKVSGREPLGERPAPPSVAFESARALGDVWALTELWKELGFGALRRVFRRTRHTTDVEALIRVMVLNRLCDPDSKLGVLRWLETVALPEVDVKTVTHQQLLRSMDALMDHQAAVDAVVTGLLRPLVDQDLSVVFYDLTTIRAEGFTTVAGDVRAFGMAKEGLIARQFMLGVVQTADGLPIYHEVFAGNAAETTTLLPTLATVLERFPEVRRLILVADRGLLSLDNLEALEAVRLANGAPLEFIIAVPGRRYHEFAELLDPFQRAHCAQAAEEVTGELAWQARRLIIAHDPATAAQQTARRNEQIAALVSQGEQWAGKLVEQDGGVKHRGRKLSDSGAKARFYHAVCEAHLSKIIRVDLKAELFCYEIDETARGLAKLMDGKLLLVTNAQELAPAEVLTRYKALADIERGFKVLKSEIEIGPVYHRLPERIRAHASICFMALILHRIMRTRLRAAHTSLTPERALEQLHRIQHHRVRLGGSEPVTGVSSINAHQNEVLSALRVKKPVAPQQLTLL